VHRNGAKRCTARWPKGATRGGQKVHHKVANKCTTRWPQGMPLGGQMVYQTVCQTVARSCARMPQSSGPTEDVCQTRARIGLHNAAMAIICIGTDLLCYSCRPGGCGSPSTASGMRLKFTCSPLGCFPTGCKPYLAGMLRTASSCASRSTRLLLFAFRCMTGVQQSIVVDKATAATAMMTQIYASAIDKVIPVETPPVWRLAPLRPRVCACCL